MIDVESRSSEPFPNRHVLLLEQLAKRASVAILTARRREKDQHALEMENRKLQLLGDIDTLLTQQVFDVQSILRTILEYAVRETQADCGQFLLREGDALVVREDHATPRSTIGKTLSLDGPGVTVAALNLRIPLNVADVAAHPWDHVYVDAIGGMKAELAIPILSGDVSLGVLNLEARRIGAFKPFHEDLGSRLAQRVSIALGLSRKIDTIHRVALTASQATAGALGQALDVVYAQVEELFPDAQCAVFLKSGDNPNLLIFTPGLERPNTQGWKDVSAVPLGVGVVGRAVASKEVIYVRNVPLGPDPQEFIEMIPNVRASVGLPLTDPQGRALGGLVVEASVPGAFTEDDVQLLQLFATFVSTAISNQLLVSELDAAKKATEQAMLQSVTTASFTVLGEITVNLIHRIGNDIGIADIELREALSTSTDRVLRRKLRTSQRNTASVLRLVNRLLRVVGDTHNLTLTDLDPLEEVQEALKEVRKLRGIPRRVRISIDAKENLPCCRSTRSLHLIIAELIVNALKAIDKGEGTIRIEIAEEQELIKIRVCNSGSVIPKQSQQYIFGFMYRSRADGRRRSGLGLGLWWARTAMRAQGGDMRLIFSDEGKGTMFEIAVRRGTHG